MSSKYVIQAKGLTKAFGDLVAVNNLELNVREGSIHGFVGPNGAGKTTTIKMLIGAIKPTSGAGTIFGYPIGSLESKRFIGYSSEHPKFYDTMTAIDYLVYIGRLCGMERNGLKERAQQLLKWLSLKESENRAVGGFSAGMKQKLSLAQAMMHGPKILILDEPTANLDPIGRATIIDHIKALAKQEKMSVLISSHILLELEKMIDTVTIINRGKKMVESDMASLKNKMIGGHYVMSTSNDALILKELKKEKSITKVWYEDGKIHLLPAKDTRAFKKKVIGTVFSKDTDLYSFSLVGETLEDIFMKVVKGGKTA